MAYAVQDRGSDGERLGPELHSVHGSDEIRRSADITNAHSGIGAVGIRGEGGGT